MTDQQPTHNAWIATAPRKTSAGGPRGLPVLGSLPEMWRDPLQFLLESSLKYGDMFHFNIGPLPFIFVSHPDAIQHILLENQRNYGRWPRDNKNYRALMGHGLLTSEGDIWRRHRKLAQPAFHRHRLEALVGTVVGAVAEVASRWEPYAASGQPMDVGAEMGWLTQVIVTRALYGLDANDQTEQIGQSLSKAIRHIAHELMLPFALPQVANRQFLSTVRALDQVVYGIIQRRQRNPHERNDLLAMLMEARDENGVRLSPQELRDEVMTFLLAGHETSALGLTWLWYLLSQHPEAEGRLQAEAAQTLGGRAPTFADLANLPFSLNVIHEGLRLYPPVGTMARFAFGADQIAGQNVPAGSVVLFGQYITHRLPYVWPNPDVFDPERFANGASRQPPRYAYFPFGGGPRQCIGSNFALMEMQVALTTLAQRFHLERVRDRPVDPRPAMDMYPRRPVMMRVIARRQA